MNWDKRISIKISLLHRLDHFPCWETGRKKYLKSWQWNWVMWNYKKCYLQLQFILLLKYRGHKITDQKFKFFTFSREEALARDKICCSDNLDMFEFQWSCRPFVLPTSFYFEFPPFFLVSRENPLMIAAIFGSNREVFVSDGCIRNVPIFNTEVGQRCFEVMPCDTAVFSLKSSSKM